MDLETENRIAAILMKEAAELRRQAQTEGALSYLRKPAVRFRPNSRFLTATVRGVQQANRAVEVNEMWRIREKQDELDNRLRGSKGESSRRRGYEDEYESRRGGSRGRSDVETSESDSYASKKRTIQDRHTMEDEGLKDDEVDEFLHSRTKRGRGAVGSRMDEAGPYLPKEMGPDSKRYVSASSDEEPKKVRVRLGPEKPFSLKSYESSDDESLEGKKKKSKTGSKKHRSKDKSRDKKKKKSKEKRSKHRK